MLSVMVMGRDMLTVSEVADLLGLTHQRVNRLAASGAFTRIARGLFDRTSVERYRAQRGRGRHRSWAEHTAWGAIALLSGAAPTGLGETQVSRLRAALREIVDAADLAARLRNRATVTTWSAHRSALDRIRADAALAAPGRERLGLVEDGNLVDGYIRAGDLDALVHRYQLVEDPRGAITLRATTVDLDAIRSLSALSSTLAAVDASTSLDPRERGVGELGLSRRLELFRDNVRA